MLNKRKVLITQTALCPMCGGLVKFRQPCLTIMCSNCRKELDRDKERDKKK